MDNFDGAEICELVGAYILNVLGKKYGKGFIEILYVFIETTV